MVLNSILVCVNRQNSGSFDPAISPPSPPHSSSLIVQLLRLFHAGTERGARVNDAWKTTNQPCSRRRLLDASLGEEHAFPVPFAAWRATVFVNDEFQKTTFVSSRTRGPPSAGLEVDPFNGIDVSLSAVITGCLGALPIFLASVFLEKSGVDFFRKIDQDTKLYVVQVFGAQRDLPVRTCCTHVHIPHPLRHTMPHDARKPRFIQRPCDPRSFWRGLSSFWREQIDFFFIFSLFSLFFSFFLSSSSGAVLSFRSPFLSRLSSPFCIVFFS